MITGFLKRNELAKLKIFAHVLYYQKVQIQDLATELSYSPRTVSRLVIELNHELKETKTTLPNLVVEGKKIRLSSQNFDKSSLSSYTKKLCLYYLKKSSEFQLFRLIFFKNYTNILEISFKLNTSQSHCYQLIHNINDLLAPFNIQINFSHFILEICGNESNITYFSSCVYDILNVLENQIVSDQKTIFHRLLSDDTFNIDSFNNQEFYYFRLIQKVYKEREGYLENISLTPYYGRELLALLTEKNNPFATQHFPNEDSLYFYNLYIRTFIPSIDNSLSRLDIGKKFHSIVDNPIVQMINELLDELHCLFETHDMKEFNQINRYEFLYLLTLHICYIDILHVDIKSLLKDDFQMKILSFLPDSRSKISIRIQEIVQKKVAFFDNWSIEMQQQGTNHLTKVICSVLFPLKQPTLHILIESFSYYSDTCALETQILNYFSQDLLIFVDNYQDADMIITDQEIPNTRNIPHFFIFDHFSNDLWEKLLAMIVQEAHKKLINSVDAAFI